MLADALADWKSGSDEKPMRPIAPGKRIALDAKLPGWTRMMIAHADGPRFRLVSLGRLIGRLGDSRHLPLLLDLIDRARLARRRARAAAFGNMAGSDASMAYDNQYREALVRLGGDPVFNAMIERFADPAWEDDPASVLSQLRAVEPRRTSLFGGQRDDITARRASLAERSHRPPDPAAAMILDRVDQLAAQGDKASIAKALYLAGRAMQMDYRNRGASLRQLLDTAREAFRFPEYCKALAERGELLPAALVHDEIDREARAVEAHWHSENDLWKLKLWIRLAAFADDPAAALPDPSQWPEQVRRQHGHQDLQLALGYPELKQKALDLAAQHKPSKIVVKEAGTGIALITELRRQARTSIIAVRPDKDKIARMSIESAKFEAGQVHLPRWAPWLPDFEAELFALPGSRHDDQIDSVSQPLANGISGYTLDNIS